MTDDTATITPHDAGFSLAAAAHRREFADAVQLMRKACELSDAAGAVPALGAMVAPAVGMATDLGTVMLNVLIRAWRMFAARVGEDPNPHLLALRGSAVVAEALDRMTDADPAEVLGTVAQLIPGYNLTAERLADALFAEYAAR